MLAENNRFLSLSFRSNTTFCVRLCKKKLTITPNTNLFISDTWTSVVTRALENCLTASYARSQWYQHYGTHIQNLWHCNVDNTSHGVSIRCVWANKSCDTKTLPSFVQKKEIAYVCDALKQNKSITWLDLSNNKLGDDGIAILGNILAVNTTLLRFEFYCVASVLCGLLSILL